jgi:hypothetical protein
MIDIDNGDIYINNGNFVIKKGLSKNNFINSNLFNEVLHQDDDIYTRYFIKPQLIGNDYFFINLYFDSKNILQLVDISMLDDDGSWPIWENWSEEKELSRRERHNKWLEDNIGKNQYKYSWGSISSTYDPRSGASSITINYSV